jgi:hypothetical protein
MLAEQQEKDEPAGDDQQDDVVGHGIRALHETFRPAGVAGGRGEGEGRTR